MSWLDTLRRAIRGNAVLACARLRAAEITVVVVAVAILCWIIFRPFRGEDALLHVSYDASRNYFNEINQVVPESEELVESVRGSHAGSIRQLDAVARGLMADSVCLATPFEVGKLVHDGMVAADWRDQWPHNASPFYSTIVFVVKAGNPKGILDWADLSRPGVTLAVPSPRVSGAGAYGFLALIQATQRRIGDDPVAIRQAVTAVYLRARIFDFGAQQALSAFVRDRSGDVFLTWESEARRFLKSSPTARFEVVYPPRSILAEPSVAVLVPHVERRGSETATRAFLDFIFSPQGQRIAATHHLRPRTPSFPDELPDLELISVESSFGSWNEAWTQHLSTTGTYDGIERLRQARAGGVE